VDVEATRTRRRARCTKLPLAGAGVNTVVDSCGRLQRHQLHLLTDAAVLNLVPWPTKPSTLRPTVVGGAMALHDLATRLLQRLSGGTQLERARQSQAVQSVTGTVSVITLYGKHPARFHRFAWCIAFRALRLTLVSGPAVESLRLRSRAAHLPLRTGAVWGHCSRLSALGRDSFAIGILCVPCRDGPLLGGRRVLASRGPHEATLEPSRHRDTIVRYRAQERFARWCGSRSYTKGPWCAVQSPRQTQRAARAPLSISCLASRTPSRDSFPVPSDSW